MILLENIKPSPSSVHGQYFTSQNRYSLKDLLLDNLLPTTSSSSRTAALKLLNTLVTRFGSLESLLGVVPASPRSLRNQLGALATCGADGVGKGELTFELPALSFVIEGLVEEDDGRDQPEHSGEDLLVGATSASSLPLNFRTPEDMASNPDTELILPDWIAASLLDDDMVNESRPSTSFHRSTLLNFSQLGLAESATITTDDVEPPRLAEIDRYLNLISDINPSALSTSTRSNSGTYSTYFHDALAHLEATQSLTAFQRTLLSLPTDTNSIAPDMPPSSIDRHNYVNSSHTSLTFVFNPSDALLRLLLDSLRNFFGQKPEENLALTGVLASLTLCEDVRLEGWLTESVATAEKESVLEESGVSAGKRILRRQGSNHDPFADEPDTQPVLFVLFRNLVRFAF